MSKKRFGSSGTYAKRITRRHGPSWNALFPRTDLSEHLTTRKLLDAWYLLAGKNMAVLVDTVKPRLFKFFAFGRYGTLQQLLYDVDCYQEAGRSGYALSTIAETS